MENTCVTMHYPHQFWWLGDPLHEGVGNQLDRCCKLYLASWTDRTEEGMTKTQVNNLRPEVGKGDRWLINIMHGGDDVLSPHKIHERFYREGLGRFPRGKYHHDHARKKRSFTRERYEAIKSNLGE
jgi:hypothetical protein